MYIWGTLNVNVKRTKTLSINVEKMFESRISATVTENYQSERNLTQKLSRDPTTRKDVRTKCVERYCELADQKTEQLYTVSTPCLDDHSFKKVELETVGELSDVRS